MKKNFYLDILLFISLLACIITGVVLDFHWFSGGREVKMVLVEVHRWTGYIGTAAILLHMVWHTKWIAVAAKKMRRARVIRSQIGSLLIRRFSGQRERAASPCTRYPKEI